VSHLTLLFFSAAKVPEAAKTVSAGTTRLRISAFSPASQGPTLDRLPICAMDNMPRPGAAECLVLPT
jgi:hypothetical protein